MFGLVALLTASCLLAAVLQPASARVGDGRCTIIPLGNGRDDSTQLLDAINSQDCREITLPQPYTYSIQQILHTNLHGKRLNVYGTLSFSTDLSYWINNSLETDFQNQTTAWLATGDNWVLSGGGFNQGGIDGNGQAWYTRAAGYGNQAGRPISLYVVNASNAVIENFSVRQPQFWAFYVDQSTNITLKGIYVNATNHDPSEPPANPHDGSLGNNWVVNTDGLDTYRSDHILVRDWVVQNGDDCIAYKGNSTNIDVRNVTCHGGNGIAFGSIGQYPDRIDNINNVYMKDVTLYPSEEPGSASTFGYPPNGGGGGTGLVTNITLEDFKFTDATEPVYLQSCLTYSSANVTQYCNTSTLVFQDITIKNFQGTASAVNNGSLVSLACSPAAPCHDIHFINFNVTVPAPYEPTYTCTNAMDVTGITCS